MRLDELHKTTVAKDIPNADTEPAETELNKLGHRERTNIKRDGTEKRILNELDPEQ
jgi:hypothetical protein